MSFNFFMMPLHRNNTQVSELGASIAQQIGVVLQRTVDLAITMTRLSDEAAQGNCSLVQSMQPSSSELNTLFQMYPLWTMGTFG
ncbi:hypothetical protein HanRHA438_Chr17g0821701 [Helianthus annuus]|nr:hypothetical protein HanRHA438_Chr17g0821701 [Helianthus annuus]